MRTIYEKMTPKEIANMLEKSINATNKEIQKMATLLRRLKKIIGF